MVAAECCQGEHETQARFRGRGTGRGIDMGER